MEQWRALRAQRRETPRWRSVWRNASLTLRVEKHLADARRGEKESNETLDARAFQLLGSVL
jgi:hypothetical protein